ncbi:MAG: Asp-tRNA(Asn)/Glu-tRNA(Gln) amidotransferase subunit GatA, partial [Verrucomicrobia bacterium]|nr:Asp-tRNA(Asn)/Glu-tRNA(Gln) amidotransferase subunit GatA [Verrucomicrobiota bacterium]
EVMESVLSNIERLEPEIGAYITLRPKGDLLREARNVDNRRRRGDAIGALAGLPVAVKDNLCTSGLRTTCASKMLSHFIPPYDATVVELLRAADGIILGKTNMDEFAMGSTTENSAMHLTRNPWNTAYVPGGTSGGSAAAVAANETIFALGTDTGGSIRQPASYCGVVGMKPTYGRVSRYGLIAYASSLDQVGVLTKDVEDAALLLAVIAKHDLRDSTSLPINDGQYTSLKAFPQELRVGISKEFQGPGLDPEVAQAVQDALKALEKLGARTIPVSLPHTQYAIPVYYIIASAEMCSNLARYDGCKYGHRTQVSHNVIDLMTKSRTEAFGTEVKRRIILGTYTLSSGYYDAYYLKAAKVRTLMRQDYEHAFHKCDLIIHPVAPTPAFRIGEKTTDPLEMYLVDIYSVIANLTGLPAISVPFGFSCQGLPIGVQLVGPQLSEDLLLRVAYNLEASRKTQKPAS